MSDFLNYSAEIALLIKLLKHNLITQDEFDILKKIIMKEYNIISDII
jgi:hypothetical protein